MKQRQGRKLNHHSTFSSLSSSSSREKASAEREKTNREGKQPLAERRSFSTCLSSSVSAPYFKKRKAEQRRREREENKTRRRKEKEASNKGER
ncbi:hypothetical protein NC652_007816 [Populus alba x Populus x berolinensis]|nr:hypothetical protein NC652_007816 [Populus alba x Populus x berolinensis]